MTILVDLETKRVLAVHHTISAMIQLNQCTPEARYFTGAGNAKNGEQVRACVSAEDAVKWIYDMKGKAFNHSEEPVSEQLLARAKLATSKVNAIHSLLVWVSSGRYQLRVGVDFSETVYMLKRQEAYAFKAAGYPDDAILNYQLVMQFADLKGISFKSAADEIIFASEIDYQVLLKTEHLRLKYLPLIKSAQTVEDVEFQIAEFLKNFYAKALV